MLLARNLRDNLGKCFRMVPEFATAVGAAARIFELVDHRSGVNYCGGLVLPDVRGELKFSNVWFEYATRPDSPVLRGLTLHIKPSQTVALVVRFHRVFTAFSPRLHHVFSLRRGHRGMGSRLLST